MQGDAAPEANAKRSSEMNARDGHLPRFASLRMTSMHGDTHA